MTKLASQCILIIITITCFIISANYAILMFKADTMQQFNSAGHGVLMFSFIGLIGLLISLNIDEQC